MSLVVTLSSIPPRFSGLGPTLKSLLGQAVAPDEIRLYIPERYRRFPDWDGTLPEVPPGITIARCDADFGPATKILPALRDGRGQDVELLLCDDDRIYDPGWTARFLAARRQHPDCVIAEAGRFVPGHDGTADPKAGARKKDIAYRCKRIVTCGRYKPTAWTRSGHVDVFKGYGGALLRPDFLPDFAFDIPELIWTVDDPWLSGCLAVNGVRIWLNAQGLHPAEGRVGRRAALLDYALKGRGRGDANEACFAWFQQNHGIWLPESVRPAPSIGPIAPLTDAVGPPAGPMAGDAPCPYARLSFLNAAEAPQPANTATASDISP